MVGICVVQVREREVCIAKMQQHVEDVESSMQQEIKMLKEQVIEHSSTKSEAAIAKQKYQELQVQIVNLVRMKWQPVLVQ